VSAKFVINGSYGTHEFDHQDPVSTIQALHAEADDRVKSARRELESRENQVIAAQITLETAIEIRDRNYAALTRLGAEPVPTTTKETV
jgi:ABC-type transporter MlaC component